ncbi:MAG TPA: Rad52/Rad22 family DNA repair protein [Pseudolabrys sp.]|nr:Rad52/Rad22 family DNA repair protein [Pseudolabrys sp.]
MSDLLQRLSAPFDPDRVSWRVGPTNGNKTKGMALAYIDARDVMARLDEACGVGGWQCSYPHANGKTVCSIGIKIGDEWIWKADGAGDTDMEAEKGALSDAFKRAAVRWSIGRYLYDMPSPWVEIEQHGKSYSIKDGELVKLARLLSHAAPVEIKRPNPHVTKPADIVPDVEYDDNGQPVDNIPSGDPSIERLPKAKAREDFASAQNELRSTVTIKQLEDWGARNANRVETFPADWAAILRGIYIEHRDSLRNGKAA